MADSIIPSAAAKPGMMARLKIGQPVVKAAAGKGALSTPEQQLVDIIQLSGDAKAKITEGRKLDVYLRTFSSALKLFSGFGFSSYRPAASTVEVEFVEAKNPYKLDKKI